MTKSKIHATRASTRAAARVENVSTTRALNNHLIRSRINAGKHPHRYGFTRRPWWTRSHV